MKSIDVILLRQEAGVSGLLSKFCVAFTPDSVEQLHYYEHSPSLLAEFLIEKGYRLIASKTIESGKRHHTGKEYLVGVTDSELYEFELAFKQTE